MKKTRTLYRAPWDFLLITITGIILTLLLGLNYLNQTLIPTLITWGIILGTATFGVYGYSIKNNELRILRLGWSKDIPLSDIKEVKFQPNAMMGSLRIAGIGGLFGYVGHFKNRVLNHYNAYATHRRKTVIITTTKNELYVVSPDQPEEFIRSLRTFMDNGQTNTRHV